MRSVQITEEMFTEATGLSLVELAYKCHGASLRLVKSGLLPEEARVARGFCKGVPGQHSWTVIGNPYDGESQIIDVTLWNYRDDVSGIWHGTLEDELHFPHGAGSIFEWGRPKNCSPIDAIRLEGLSATAQDFLDLLGPLDLRGWQVLLSQAPVEGWPSSEILSAAYVHETLGDLVPIDHVGMLTDINPAGLYMAGPADNLPEELEITS